MLRDAKGTGDERNFNMAGGSSQSSRFCGNYEVILTPKLRLGPHLWYHLALETYLPRLVVFGGKRLDTMVGNNRMETTEKILKISKHAFHHF